MIILSHKRQDTIVMMIPCLCSFRSSSCDLRHKKIPRPNGLAASFLVDIPTRWEPRAKQQQRVALADFSAAPWQGFEKSERCPNNSSLFLPQAAVVVVALDRSLTLPTGVVRAALFSSCTAHHKKIPRPNGLGMWWTVQDSNL